MELFSQNLILGVWNNLDGALFVIALRINEIEQLVALHGIRLGKKKKKMN